MTIDLDKILAETAVIRERAAFNPRLERMSDKDYDIAVHNYTVDVPHLCATISTLVERVKELEGDKRAMTDCAKEPKAR
jgi:hypothetical protein